jgi:hypothetical protein
MNAFRRRLLCTLIAACVLAGCSSEDHATVAPKSADAAPARRDDFGNPAKDPLAAASVTVAADALTVGTVVGPTGEVQRSPGPFAASDTVQVSFPKKGFEPGAPVVVYWTYQDGRSHHEERTTLPAEGDFARYSFSSSQGMKPGNYNVEVQVKGRPVGIVDFAVR